MSLTTGDTANRGQLAGWDKFLAGKPITECATQEERNGWLAAFSCYDDNFSETTQKETNNDNSTQ
jgi:hypothetical protein